MSPQIPPTYIDSLRKRMAAIRENGTLLKNKLTGSAHLAGLRSNLPTLPCRDVINPKIPEAQNQRPDSMEPENAEALVDVSGPSLNSHPAKRARLEELEELYHGESRYAAVRLPSTIKMMRLQANYT